MTRAAHGPPLSFTPVQGWRAAEAHRPAWEALARETRTWLPYQEPVWSEAWWRGYGEGGGLCRRRFILWLGRDERGEVRAVLPAVLSIRPGRGPLSLRVLSPVGPDPNVTELQPILCRPEDDLAAHDGILAALRERCREWDAFRWLSVPASAAPRLRAEPGVDTMGDLPGYVLALGPDWDAFRAALPRKLKDHLRKAYNNPARDGIELEFAAREAEADVRPALAEFLALYSARSHVRRPGQPAYEEAFARRAARATLEGVVGEFAKRGAVVFLTLRHARRTVASRLAFRGRDTLYLYHAGFDREYSAYSVGTRNLVEGLQWASRRGVRFVNLSTGADPSKTRWRPEVVPYERLWQWSPTSRGRLAAAVARLLRKA